MSLLRGLFPSRIDADFRGHPAAVWLFVPLTLMTIGRSLVHVFAPDGGAQTIATIPLDRMTPAGAEGIVSLFALWGLSQLLLGLVFVAVLVRYRAWLAFMYLLVILEYAGRLAIGMVKPVATVGTAPGAGANLVLPFVGLVGLVLALRRRDGPESSG